MIEEGREGWKKRKDGFSSILPFLPFPPEVMRDGDSEVVLYI
jgi:hypothetical protein